MHVPLTIGPVTTNPKNLRNTEPWVLNPSWRQIRILKNYTVQRTVNISENLTKGAERTANLISVRTPTCLVNLYIILRDTLRQNVFGKYDMS